jgi:hypothetical protein
MDTSEDREPTKEKPPTHGSVADHAPGYGIDAFLDAATDAELETGRREVDRETARAHVLVRLVRGAAGIALTIVGVALTVLPGPGVLLILAGLGILAIDYPFAARLRDRLLTTGGHLAGRAGRILRRVLALLGVALLLLAAGVLVLLALIARALA